MTKLKNKLSRAWQRSRGSCKHGTEGKQNLLESEIYRDLLIRDLIKGNFARQENKRGGPGRDCCEREQVITANVILRD